MVRLHLSASRFVRARVGAPRAAAVLTAAFAALASVTPASAHGFGQRYELPLPLSLYLFGAAAAVALSFVVFGLFVRRGSAPHTFIQIDLVNNAIGRMIAHEAVLWTLRLAVLGLFVVAILAGLIGDPNPYRNIAPTLVWITWWVGFAYVQAFLGDLWSLINPWRTAFDAAELAVPTRWGTKRARLAAVLSARARSLAGLPPPFGLLLDRTRLSQRSRSGAHRLLGDHLFDSDLDRHAHIRP